MSSLQLGFDPNKIVRQNIEFYNSIKPRVESKNYTVLATLNDASSSKLLALATGTQASLKQYDNDIEDCHAESLLKRAYKRYLLDKILLAMSDHEHLNGSDVKLRLSQIIDEINNQELVLFVSQFPCGLINRFEGTDPADEETGAPIIRKPGRGQVLNGRVVYVTRDTCLKKLMKWTSSYGFAGRSIGTKLGIRSKLTGVLIGNCEPDTSLDYGFYLTLLSEKLLSCAAKPVHFGLVDMRHEEFTFQTGNKLPLYVATVWWASPSPYHVANVRDTLEYVVDGRRLGVTKKQCASNNVTLKLRSSDFWLQRDLTKICGSAT